MSAEGVSKWFNERGNLLCYSVVFVSLLMSMAFFWHFLMDDALIVGTFAKNIVSGWGYGFNPHEPSSGSTPIYTMLVALFFKVFGASEIIFHVLGVFFLATGLILYWKYAKLFFPERGEYVFASLLVTATFAYTLMLGQAGMDTILFLSISLLVLYVHAKAHKPLLVYLLAGLCFLARYEGVLLFTSILAYDILGERGGFRFKIKTLALGFVAFGLVVSPWIAWNYLNFNTLRPSPFSTKTQTYMNDAMKLALSDNIVIHYTLENTVKLFKYNPILFMLSVLGAITLVLSHVKKTARVVPSPVYTLTVYVLLFVLFYSVVSPIPSGRYIYPIVPLIFLLGFYWIGNMDDVFRLERYAGIKNVAFVLALAGSMLINGVWLYHEYYRTLYWGERYNIYRDVALWINRNAPKDAVVATSELGYVGFYSERKVLDLAGIVYPYNESLVDRIRVKKPDYVFHVANSRYLAADDILKMSDCKTMMEKNMSESVFSEESINRVLLLECRWS